MNQPAQSKMLRWRLARLWKQVVGGIALVCASVLPQPAHAEKTGAPSSFSARAAKVKDAIEQMAPGMQPTVAPPSVMQWGNWPNWQNWGNWGNWNNWNNWPNWVNW